MVFASCNNEVVFYGCEKFCNVAWISSIVDITVTKEMCSVSVSGSKVLRLLVIDLHWKYLSRPIRNGRTRHLASC